MIEIKNLDFSYGKTKIFDGFDLTVNEGQVTLITGINGVGKSTLLRLIAGVLKPAGGQIIFHEKMGDNPKRYIGFISDTLSLYESMTVEQAIAFHSSVYNITSFEDGLLKRTRINPTQRIKELSVGQRAILHLSLLLSSGAKLLLIDEILHSIDVYLRGVFLKELIKLMTERDVTVVFVNLNFRDIENMVDRVILLKDGKIAVDEEIDALKAKVKKVTSETPPEKLPVLFKVEYSDHSEYYIYPFAGDHANHIDSDIADLDLTSIVNAFIGNEYVD